MTDIFTREKRSEIMSRIKSKDTKPEMRVRTLLFSRGFRYKLHNRKVLGQPDLVLPKFRTVVFVNGCFWHGHSCKIGSGKRKPKTNKKYWCPKLEKNVERDRNNWKKLASDGWKIIVIWECQTFKEKTLLSRLRSLLRLKEAV